MRRTIALACLLFCAGSASAQKRPPFILLLVPGLKAEDLTRPELTSLESLAQGGAYGWMNARTARVTDPAVLEPDGRSTIESACVTINAGSRATAASDAGRFSEPSIRRLREANRHIDHAVPLGALGDLLHSAGLKTAVIGNADTGDKRDLGRLIAMDSQGRVDTFLTGDKANIRDADAPYGRRADLDLFSRRVNADFRVWVFADLWRAERYAPLCSPHQALAHRGLALTRLGELLEIAAPMARSGSAAFMLVSPAPAPSASSIDRLAPIARFGSGAGMGILRSPSTRTDGLVTNTDLLPTIAAYFSLPAPRGSVGRPITVASRAPSADGWRDLHRVWLLRSRKQAAFGGAPLLQLLLVASAIISWSRYRRTAVRRYRRLTAAAAVSSLSLPAAQLALPPVVPYGVLESALILAGAVLLVSILCASLPDAADRVAAALCAALIGMIAVDLLVGQPLLRQAWMSYSVMEGARYYGLGNEYAGAALGSLGALGINLGAGISMAVVPYVFASFGLIAGIPSLGADAGAMLSFLVAAGASAMRALTKVGRRASLIGVVVVILLAVGVVLLDFAQSGPSQSHIARSFDGGIGAIISRKLALNGYLLLHSSWTLCLIAGLIGLWQLRPRIAASERTAAARSSVLGLGAGTTALLLFNDSGVIAGANAILVWWAVEMILAVANRSRRTESHSTAP